jgi:hypothetical protein
VPRQSQVSGSGRGPAKISRWVDMIPTRSRKSPTQNSVEERDCTLMNGDPQVTLLGLFMIRVSWVMAALGCMIAILIALFSGTDARDFSILPPGLFDRGGSARQTAEPAAFDPATPLSAVGTAGSVSPRRAPALGGQATRIGDPGAAAPNQSGSQPGHDGGRAPNSAPRPTSPQTPSGSQPSRQQGTTGSPSSSSPQPQSPQLPSVSPTSTQTPSVSTTTSVSTASPEPSSPSAPSAPSAPRVSVSVSGTSPQASVSVGDTTVELP